MLLNLYLVIQVKERKKEDDKHENCKGLKGTNFAFKRRKKYFFFIVESRSSVGLWVTSCQDSTKDQTRRNPDSGNISLKGTVDVTST